ncbi:MAG: glycosyltransferase [Selenomonadaceae bacterium]|nr:glycosyltransferase [Selenomonadaceae bacterium]
MKVSVIIPMYNAEKYLNMCLESLLIQTLTDFEVIVVDDASTDNSVAIAESYLERFGGRLKILVLEENTGTPGLPRNIGLEYACGEYVYFVDSDDFIIDSALEKLFNCAENYRAEIIFTDSSFGCGEELIPENLEFVTHSDEKILDEEPTFETENLAERVEKFLRFGFDWVTWLKFSRRDFLTENKIYFPAAKTSEDGVWTFKILCTAERLLRIHEPFYVQRSNKNSITRRNRSLEDWIILHTNSLIKNVDSLAEFMSGLEFFQKNPATRLRIIDYFISKHLVQMELVKNKLSANELYEIFQREFLKTSSPALSAYLLLLTKLYRNELAK